MDVGTLSVKLSVLDQDAIKSLDSFQDKMKSVGANMAKIGAGMTIALTTPIVLAGKNMFTAASDFAESINKVEVSFGDASDEVKNFAKTALKNFGIAEGSALDMAALFGDMGTSMGLTTKDAAGMSKGLVGLAGDLASFKNVQIDVAQTALAGIFTGETESLKRLGIVMTEANLEQFALSKGYQTLYKDLTQAEKVQLRYEYVTEMSKNAVGDFARTSDGAANQTRTLSESLKEASTEFGQELLPLLVPIIEALTDMVKWFGSLDSNVKTVIIVIAGLIAVLGPVLSIMGSVLIVVGAMTPAMLAMVAPIAAVVAGIVALIAIGVLLYKNWDEIVAYAGRLWEGVKAGFMKMWEAIQSVFTSFIKGGLLGLINDYIMKPFFDIDLFQVGKDILISMWDGMSSWVSTLYNNIKNALNGLVSKAKEVLGIKSPSTIFYDIGVNVVKGLSNAITSQMSQADIQSFNNNPYTNPLGTTIKPQATAPTNLGVVGGVQQTVVINSPNALDAKTVSKETTKLAQALAKGLYV